MIKQPNVVRFKTTRKKHRSGYRVFDVNGVVGSDVVNIVINGVKVCGLDISDDGYINLFSNLSNYTIKAEDEGMSECNVYIDRKNEKENK